MRKGYVLLRSAARTGREVHLHVAQRHSLTMSSFFRRVPRHVKLRPPQLGPLAVACLCGTRAILGMPVIRLRGNMVTVSSGSQKSNGDYTQSLAWRAHALSWS